MEGYIKKYKTGDDYRIGYYTGELKSPYVAYIENSKNIEYNTIKFEDYENEYFQFIILSGGTVSWNTPSSEIYYRINGGSWIQSTQATTINGVRTGDIIEFKGWNNSVQGLFAISTDTSKYAVAGNIKTLFFEDVWSQDYVEGVTYSCMNLFSGNTSVISARCLHLTNNFCNGTFKYCTSLKVAPESLNDTLEITNCYRQMFDGCTSLKVPPKLPATTLVNNCYLRMFQGCTSLTTAPELPAMYATNSCYLSMFSRCTSLTTAPALPATTLDESCYSAMFDSCSSLTTAPVLPAETLLRQSYNGMFRNCSKINYIKCLALNGITRDNVFSFYGTSPTGTLVKHPNATWPDGIIPEGWTIVDAE